MGAHNTSSYTDDHDQGATEPDEAIDGKKGDPEQSGIVRVNCKTSFNQSQQLRLRSH